MASQKVGKHEVDLHYIHPDSGDMVLYPSGYNEALEAVKSFQATMTKEGVSKLERLVILEALVKEIRFWHTFCSDE